MKNLKLNSLILILLTISLFNGCAIVDRGNFQQMGIGELGQSWKNSYDVIDTSKENIGIPKPPVSVVERFEVQDGGCSGQDCGNKLYANGNRGDRERIELKVLPHHRDTYNGDEHWYTWSIYFPKDFKSIEPAQTDLGQFYAKGYGPIYMFVIDNGYRIKKQVDPLIKEEDLRGKWHTIKIHAKWSNTNGLFKVWVDGKLKYNGTGIYKDGIYFKYGIYRTYVSQWKTEKVMNLIKNMKDSDLTYREKYLKASEEFKTPTQVVYYSNVRRANTEKGLIPKK